MYEEKLADKEHKHMELSKLIESKNTALHDNLAKMHKLETKIAEYENEITILKLSLTKKEEESAARYSKYMSSLSRYKRGMQEMMEQLKGLRKAYVSLQRSVAVDLSSAGAIGSEMVAKVMRWHESTIRTSRASQKLELQEVTTETKIER